MIPSQNILNMAMRMIAPSCFVYYKFSSRYLNEIGMYVTTYSSGIRMTGSVQPIPRTLYQSYGLDFQKNYYNFYLSKGVLDVTRDISGDQFEFTGKRFQCLSKTDWFAIDGWDAVLCVEVPKENE